MIHHRHKVVLIGIAAASTLAVAIVAVPALASHGFPGFNPTPISFGVFGPFDVKAEKSDKWDLAIKSHGQTDVRVTNVAIAAGGSSNWHSHPGPNLLMVKLGTVTEYEGSDPLCSQTTYTQGQTFGDNGGSAIHLVRNETGAPAEVIAVAFYPHGATPTVTKTIPTNCTAVGAPAH